VALSESELVVRFDPSPRDHASYSTHALYKAVLQPASHRGSNFTLIEMNPPCPDGADNQNDVRLKFRSPRIGSNFSEELGKLCRKCTSVSRNMLSRCAAGLAQQMDLNPASHTVCVQSVRDPDHIWYDKMVHEHCTSILTRGSVLARSPKDALEQLIRALDVQTFCRSTARHLTQLRPVT
jgi:hypothetical protein